MQRDPSSVQSRRSTVMLIYSQLSRPNSSENSSFLFSWNFEWKMTDRVIDRLTDRPNAGPIKGPNSNSLQKWFYCGWKPLQCKSVSLPLASAIRRRTSRPLTLSIRIRLLIGVKIELNWFRDIKRNSVADLKMEVWGKMDVWAKRNESCFNSIHRSI